MTRNRTASNTATIDLVSLVHPTRPTMADAIDAYGQGTATDQQVAWVDSLAADLIVDRPMLMVIDWSSDESVTGMYLATDTKGKAAIRTKLDELTKSAIMDKMDIVEGKRLMNLAAAVKVAKVTPPVAVIDWQELVSVRYAVLSAALADIASDAAGGVPDDVTIDLAAMRARADAILTDADCPNVPDDFYAQITSYKTVNSPKSAKSGKSGGVRRDIGQHIAEWAASVDAGTFATVQQVANFRSDEYGTDGPSAGAVAARLFPAKGTCTVGDVTPVDATATTPRGVIANG